MSHNDNIRKLIRELVEEELDEVTTSGATPGYMTPGAFVGPKGKKVPKKGVDEKDHTPVKFGGTGGALKASPIKEDADASIISLEKSLQAAKDALAAAEERTKGQTQSYKGGTGGFGGPHYSLKQRVRDIQSRLQRARQDKELETWRKNNKQSSKTEQVVEGRYHEYKVTEGHPRQKIGRAIREINQQLHEIDRVVKMNARLKTETNLQSGDMWKSTSKGLAKLEGKLVELANRIRELKA